VKPASNRRAISNLTRIERDADHSAGSPANVSVNCSTIQPAPDDNHSVYGFRGNAGIGSPLTLGLKSNGCWRRAQAADAAIKSRFVTRFIRRSAQLSTRGMVTTVSWWRRLFQRPTREDGSKNVPCSRRRTHRFVKNATGHPTCYDHCQPRHLRRVDATSPGSQMVLVRPTRSSRTAPNSRQTPRESSRRLPSRMTDKPTSVRSGTRRCRWDTESGSTDGTSCGPKFSFGSR
jgi:hypothetical protein